ncbi:MAG TPA: enoyl-CoA hydratase/isomerase family protein [Steroidobacteraceae bacterium]|jgi:methylglutaconyl-CoA hydratase|nr:enoyl-CoA hydratase/isomerase family protein [Steroidobacteraceae bacterium]
MADFETLQLESDRGCTTVWLNRPDRHNAFHEGVIADLTRCFERLSTDPAVRMIVLAGRGRSFCAGADLEWMQRQASAHYDTNIADARRLAIMLRTIAQTPKPILARVHGAALGGGLGLICVCDLAIAAPEATFGTTEVRLGLTPSTIAPYVLNAIGERAAGRYFLTGERFDAHEALRIGLVHELVEADALDAQLAKMLDALRQSGPKAQAHCKELVALLRDRDPTEPLILEQTARSIADVRSGEEAREGIAAFLAKRKPGWIG